MTDARPRVIAADAAGIVAAAAAIRAGQPVAVPTETVYGLAADATDGAAIARLYAAKGRPAFNPLIVHVLDSEAAGRTGVLNETAQRLAAAFWPGPLTLVVPRRAASGIASLATAGLDTIALRVPAHPAMRALLTATGRPLAAPSANRSGALSPTRADHVVASLGASVPLVIDGGASERGVESTIVLAGPGPVAILRPGPITSRDIATVLGDAALSETIEPSAGTPIAPGQLAGHYAPAKPLRLAATSAKRGEWLIGFGAIRGDATLSSTGDPVEAAARLFDLLHQADATDRPRIAVAPIPLDGIGTAITDRLRRAAHRD